MADETKPSFDELSDQAKEAVTPRGEYKNPEALDQGNGYEGAPKGGDTPEGVQTDPGVDPADQQAAEGEGDAKPAPKRGRRTT